MGIETRHRDGCGGRSAGHRRGRLYADLRQCHQGDVNIERVWAQIIAPNANIGGGTETIAYPEIALTLNASTQRYEGTLTGLTVSGIYKIVVLARDVNKEVSDPATAFITVASPPMPGDVNGDGNVTLADAILTMQLAAGMVPPAGAIQEGYGPLRQRCEQRWEDRPG